VAFVHVVRHAVALDRRSWPVDDWQRPLSPRGHAQARALAGRYASAPPDRFVSSPALRCVQTLQPTADAGGKTIERVAYLEEGAPPERAERRLLDLVAEIAEAAGTVGTAEAAEVGRGHRPGRGAGGATGRGPLLLACTHGDVLDGLIGMWLGRDVVLDGPARAPKAVTFELEVSGGAVTRACFVAPPDAGR
jgi:8-oxo-dGTP diphosphatase